MVRHRACVGVGGQGLHSGDVCACHEVTKKRLKPPRAVVSSGQFTQCAVLAMNPTLKSIPIVLVRPETPTQRAVAHLKGRQPDGDALLEVSTLVGVRPPEGYRRD